MSERTARVNIPILILSMIVSFILWAVVYTQTTPTQPRSIEVTLELTGLDSRRFAVKRPPQTLNVTAIGSQQQLTRLEASHPKGQVDLERAKAGKGRYPVALFPSLMRELAANTLPLIELEIEEKVTKTIPVRVETQGQLADPTQQIRDKVAVPAQVTVTAPASEDVAEARAILNLSQIDPTSPDPIYASVQLYNKNGREIDNTEVSVAPATVELTPILSTAPVRRTAAVQVQLLGSPHTGFAYTGYVVSPNKVTLAGTTEALSSLTQVQSQPVDLTGLAADQSFDVPIVLPRGVSTSSPARVRVRVSIRRVQPGAPR